MPKLLSTQRTQAISELEQLIARAETALAAIEARGAADARDRDAERARLARIESAAAQTVAALDDLLAAQG